MKSNTSRGATSNTRLLMNDQHPLAWQPSMSLQGTHWSPFRRFVGLLQENRSALAILLCYTFLSGTMSLAVPLTAQALVNIIAAGVFIQPLVILTALLLGALVFLSIIRLLEFSLIETIRQHTFADVALQFGYKIPRIRHSALANEYMPELVNRFFDVVNVQKSWAKLLLEVPAAVLQIVVGLVLMAFYNPFFLAFGLFIAASIIAILFGLGIGGLASDIETSLKKYKVAEWLEELARCETSCKMAGVPNYLMKRTDELVMDYLHARKQHFGVVYRQFFANYFFQAAASAGILGIGGWLVIDRQLTLGQLVAAELIVVGVLGATEKLVRSLESYYDLLTGLEKVGHIIDLPTERDDGKLFMPNQGGATLQCKDLRFSYRPGEELIAGVTFSVGACERVSLVGHSGVGKSTLASLICGLQTPSHGSIKVNGIELRDLSLQNYRRHVTLVTDANEIFDGTLAENITLGRDFVSYADLIWAIELTRLDIDLLKLPAGLNTRLVSAGQNLSRGQIQRVLIARGIVERPELLILDEAFSGIDENTKLAIVDELCSPVHPWTLINISHDAQTVWRTSFVYVLSRGKIIEMGTPADLAKEPGTAFSSLFTGRASRTSPTPTRKRLV